MVRHNWSVPLFLFFIFAMRPLLNYGYASKSLHKALRKTVGGVARSQMNGPEGHKRPAWSGRNDRHEAWLCIDDIRKCFGDVLVML